MANNPHTGSSFDDFLKEEGIYEEVSSSAIKEVLVWQLEQAMKEQNISKSDMAARMGTSRSQLNRILDPTYTGMSLEALDQAASVLGYELKAELVPA